MERWIGKVLALIGTFILPLVCTVLPYKVSGFVSRRGDSGKKILSCLMCFGGGIFFGTFLLHMGPEVRFLVKESLNDPYHIDYPLADLIVGFGFFLVLFAEKVVLRVHNRRSEARKRLRILKMPERRVQLEVPVEHGPCDDCSTGKYCPLLADEAGKNIRNGGIEPTSSNHSDNKAVWSVEDDRQNKEEVEIPILIVGKEHSHVSESAPNGVKKEENNNMDPQNNSANEDDDGGHHHHSTRSIILILALSLHRIFEGMSIGLQNSLHTVGSLFLAVMCHEMVIGFSLGLQFVKCKFPLRQLLVTSFVCSVIMPTGVLVGILMTEVGTTSGSINVANGILQAIAMGTFIYVTFFEILQEEVDPADTSLGKIVCIALGFMMMALLDLIPEESSIIVTSPVLLKNSTMYNTV